VNCAIVSLVIYKSLASEGIWALHVFMYKVGASEEYVEKYKSPFSNWKIYALSALSEIFFYKI
jgi:hypothetical protein